MSCRHFLLLLLLLLQGSAPSVFCKATSSDDLGRVLFVVNSQSHSVHQAIALQTKRALEFDLGEAGVKTPRVILSHQDEDVPRQGAWTYIPTIEYLSLNYGKTINWALFIEENTRVDLQVLKTILKAESSPKQRAVFIGHALRGRDEFDEEDLNYPHVSAGFLMSVGALHFVREKVRELRDTTDFPHYIAMNPHFELAKVLMSRNQKQQQLGMTHDPRFCFRPPPPPGDDNAGCATSPVKVLHCNASSEDVVHLAKKTLFAVKTCGKFHSTRLPVLRDTWHRAAINVEYFSEKADDEFGTKVLPGVRNTEKGHCKKSEAIVNYFARVADRLGYQWLVVADDDTVLGVTRMMELIKCYDGREAVLLGERYGFNVVSGSYGYEYITGGGGMVMNLAAAQKMSRKKNVCSCPQEDYFDDLHLGECFTNLDVALVHSARLHQRRPEEYPAELLQVQDPVSFHKFENTDPRKTYDTYFRDADQLLVDYKIYTEGSRSEL